MALSSVTYPSDGSNRVFSIPFEYLSRSHVKVLVGDTATSFVFVNSATVELAEAAPAGSIVTILRETPIASKIVSFADSSTLKSASLNLADLQKLYAIQELLDRADIDSSRALRKNDANTVYDALLLRIGNVAEPTGDYDATNKKYVRDQIVQAEGIEAGQLRADLGTAAIGSDLGFNLVHYPVRPGEVGVVKPQFVWGDIRRYGALVDGVTDDTIAVQNAEDSASVGSEIVFPSGTCVVTGNISYKGGVTHRGLRGSVVLLKAGSVCDAVFIPKSWLTANAAEMQSVAQANKFRPVFWNMGISGNSGNGGEGHGLILTSSEALVLGCRIVSNSKYGVFLTPRNKNGDTTGDGYNFLQNFIVFNRINSNGLGGIRAEDDAGGSSKTTDGWACFNSITGGTEFAIYIDAAQGWRILGNQTSSTTHGIWCVKTNRSIIANNVLNAFGGTSQLGRRVGIFAGGLTQSYADVVVSDNSIEALANPIALVDSTSSWVAVLFYGRTSGTKNKIANITGNNIVFTGFSGTSGKTVGIQQSTNVANTLRGVIANNTLSSDQDTNGCMLDAQIDLHPSARFQIANNSNGSKDALVVGPSRPQVVEWVEYKTDIVSGVATTLASLIYSVPLHGTLEVEVSVGPSDSEGYAQSGVTYSFGLAAYSSSVSPRLIGVPSLADGSAGATPNASIEAIPAAGGATTDTTAASAASVNAALAAIRNNFAEVALDINRLKNDRVIAGSFSTGVRSISEPVITLTSPVLGQIDIQVAANTGGSSSTGLYSCFYRVRFFGQGVRRYEYY